MIKLGRFHKICLEHSSIGIFEKTRKSQLFESNGQNQVSGYGATYLDVVSLAEVHNLDFPAKNASRHLLKYAIKSVSSIRFRAGRDSCWKNSLMDGQEDG